MRFLCGENFRRIKINKFLQRKKYIIIIINNIIIIIIIDYIFNIFTPSIEEEKEEGKKATEERDLYILYFKFRIIISYSSLSFHCSCKCIYVCYPIYFINESKKWFYLKKK